MRPGVIEVDTACLIRGEPAAHGDETAAPVGDDKETGSEVEEKGNAYEDLEDTKGKAKGISEGLFRR